MGYMAFRAFGLAIITTLVVAVPASAGVPHTVQPGESLWSIAAANNFTTRSLAAANGLSENSSVVLGSTIQIPSVSEASSALANAGVAAPQTAGPGVAPSASAPQSGYAV